MTRSAFVSTYPPRHCGIATFTQHLATAVGGREIVALHASDLPSPYALEVHHRLRTSEPEEFTRTAATMRGCADVVSIQHAFGIWGPDETAVLEFARALEVPAVATLHNVPPRRRRSSTTSSRSSRRTSPGSWPCRRRPRCCWPRSTAWTPRRSR